MSTSQKLQHFSHLHQADTPLLLANVWDAHSAKLAQEAGLQAVGTSSHAIAFSQGYADGEEIPLERLLPVIERVVAVCTIPVSVDFESGYSDDPQVVAQSVKQLFDLGVVGINLEDGKVVDGKRVLSASGLLAEKIKAIKSVCPIFINARIDTFTTQHPDALKESISRAHIYGKAGADGIFVPLIEDRDDIKQFTSAIPLPLNVFATRNLPDYEVLQHLGVKRISHGAKQYEKLMSKASDLFKALNTAKDVAIML